MTDSTRRYGHLLHTSGKVLFWAGLVIANVAIAARRELQPFTMFALVSGFTAVAFAGVAVMHHARRLLAISGDQRLATDRRKPVVYLRSFAADSAGAGAVSSWLLLRFGYSTDEEQLATVMHDFGPFVAIGDPREPLPSLGADRIYVADGDWQTRVRDLLRSASLVVLRAGTTENFWWEFQTVRECVAPERVLLLIGSGRGYKAFRSRAETMLPWPLPDVSQWQRILSHVRAVIVFDESWRAQQLPIVRSFRRSAFTAPFVSRLKLTLQPVYERFRVPWVPPPVARKKLIVIATSGTVSGVLGALVLMIYIQDSMSGLRTAAPVQLLPLAVTATEPSATESPSRDAIRAAPSRYDAQLEILSARLSSVPGFVQSIANLSPAAARERGQRLALLGLKRLTDDQLATRARLMNAVLERSDEQTCAAIFTGAAAPGLEAALRKLSDSDLQEWLDMVFASTIAELERRKVPEAPAAARTSRAMQSLLARLPAAEAESLQRALAGPPQRISLTQACTAAKHLYAGLVNLPVDERAVLTRALVAP